MSKYFEAATYLKLLLFRLPNLPIDKHWKDGLDWEKREAGVC